MAQMSLIQRFINLFKSKASRTLDMLETPEVLAENAKREAEEAVEKLEARAIEVIQKARRTEIDQQNKRQEAQKLRVQIESTIALHKETTDPAQKEQLESLLANYHESYQGLVESIKNNDAIIAETKKRIDVIKEEVAAAKNSLAARKREVDSLLARNSAAKAAEAIVDIRALASPEFGQLKELADKVENIEAGVMAKAEIAALDPAVLTRQAERQIEQRARKQQVKDLLNGEALAEIPSGSTATVNPLQINV